MPRLLVYATKYADEHFRTEVRKQQGVLDLMSMQALADAVGIPRQTLCKRMATPDGMTVAELRKLVDKAKLDPAVILELVGYTSKDIRKLREPPEKNNPQSAGLTAPLYTSGSAANAR